MSSVDSQTTSSAPLAPPQNRWTFWRVLRWTAASLLLLLIIIAAYLWQNRYSFLEDTLKDILAEQGLETELSIREIQKTQATLSDIAITSEGSSVFSADGLKIDYYWRDALKGRMKRIELKGAELTLTVDETGKIIDGWLPASNEESELILPPQGLHLTGSRLTVQSPYGLVNASGDVTFNSFEDLDADIVVAPSAFSFGALEVKGGGKIKARIRPGENTIKAALDFTDMVHPLAGLSYASVNADVTFDLVDGQSQITGPLSLDFAQLKGGSVSAENGKLTWNGSFAVRPDSAAIRQADGKWSGDIGRMTYGDIAGRRKLASALTLNDALKAAPVTTHFADSLTGSVQSLLVDADVTGSGSLLRIDDKVEVSLSAPLTLKTKSAAVTVNALDDTLFYDYNRVSEAIEIAGNVSLSAPRSVKLNNMTVTARSPNGLSVSDVTEFGATAVIDEIWEASSPDGAVRLAPLSAKTRYVNDAARRDMRVDLSAVTYDGPLPGGFAQGFQTQGTLVSDLSGGGLSLSFTPLDSQPMSVTQFTTPTGWTAKDAQFTLISDAPFFERGANPENAVLTARIENARTALFEDETGRQLDLTLVSADITTDITGERQDWTITAAEAEVKTDDFAGEGTVVGAPSVSLTAIMRPERDMQIALTSASARVQTDQLSTTDMKISLKGTPTDFELDYGGDTYASAGMVTFTDETLPQLPLRGQLNFKDGLIIGEAKTILPEAEDTDINVAYRLKDGEGTAKINIPALRFDPKGLQPQNLVSALQGKIAEVSGTVSASIDLAFAPNTPLKSSGRATLNNLDFGTLPGPFRGVSTELEFSSVFPLVSEGVQRMTVKSFNPGVDLLDGVMEYQLIDGGVEILSAKWPLANGFIFIDPTIWKYDAEQNRVVLRIDGVSVGAFLGNAGSGGLTVTGDIVGEIPVVIEGVQVRIDQGSLAVENGGVIQYTSQELTSVVDLIPEKYVTLQDYEQFREFRKNEDLGENVGKDLAFTALRNFEYKSLGVKLNGPLDGEIEVNIRFLGRNPKILDGTEFDFNVTIVGELVNLVRSFKPDPSLERLKGYLRFGESSTTEDQP